MPQHCTKIVIIGAGAAGLLSAILLAKQGKQVHLIESRAKPFSSPLPQYGHVHNLLLESQYALIEALPEIEAILKQLGALRVDWNGDFPRSTPAGLGAAAPSSDKILVAGREEWDKALWQIAENTPGLTILTGHQVVGLEGGLQTIEIQLSSYSGIQTKPQEHAIQADLCIDASGRMQIGYHLLKEKGLKIDTETYKTPMHYRSKTFKKDVDENQHQLHLEKEITKALAAVEVEYTSKGGIRGAMLLPSNSTHVLVSAVSSDRADLERFAQSPKAWLQGLNEGLVADASSQLLEEPESERRYGWSQNYLHQFESLDLQLPIIMVGDALCATAPILGLGMSRSILDALLVSSNLSQFDQAITESRRNDLVHRIHKSLAQQAKRDMEIAKMLAFEMGTLENVPYLLRAKVMFRDFFLAAATKDPVLHQIYIDVRNRTRSNIAILSPTSLVGLVKYTLGRLING